MCGFECRKTSVIGTRMLGTPTLAAVGGRNLKSSSSQSTLSAARPRGSGLRFIALLEVRPPTDPSALKRPKTVRERASEVW